MKTTFCDVVSGLCETREHERSATKSRMGRSSCVVTCPFCGEKVTAFIWSIAGGGKRCPCGAIHDAEGRTHKRKSQDVHRLAPEDKKAPLGACLPGGNTG